MKLIKMDGETLSNPDNIFKAIAYLENSNHEAAIVMVCGSVHTEKKLLEIATSACEQSQDYIEYITVIEKEFLGLARLIVPITQQSSILSFVKQRFNELEDLCKGVQLLGELPEKTIHEILSYPSTLTSFLFAAACKEKIGSVSWTDARSVLTVNLINGAIVCNDASTALNLKEQWTDLEFKLNVVSGGMGKTENGNTVHFGKGGGDLAASYIAGAANACEIEIWANGKTYSTADPLLVKNARSIKELTYKEAIELTHFENAIIAPSALNSAFQKNIPIRLLQFNNLQNESTLIHKNVAPKSEMITGISSLNNIALISIEGSGMIGVPGFAKRVFACLNDASINVILISQGSSEHSICVAVHGNARANALELLETEFTTEISNGIIQPIQPTEAASIVALVGENMRNHPGISGRMFSALGRSEINILAIAQGSNERNISAVILSSDRIKALNVLHEAFFEGSTKQYLY